MHHLNHLCHCVIGVPCCNITHTSEGDDDVVFDLGEDLIREDVVTTGFLPEDYTFPLRLTVSHVSGDPFNKSRMCPPTGLDSVKSASTASSWVPPVGQELFVSVTQMEDLAPEPPINYGAFVGAFALVGACGVGLVAVGWCLSRFGPKKKDSEDDCPETGTGMEKQGKKRKDYTPVPVSLGSNTLRLP